MINMVRLFWLIFFLIPVSLFAQNFPIDAASGKIYYAEEVLVKDGPLLDLYNRAKVWFAGSGNSKAWQVDDVANGLLIGRSNRLLMVSDGHNNNAYRLWYTLKIEMEDDRYWYSLSNFKIQKVTIAAVSVSGENQEPMQPLEDLVFSRKMANIKEKEKIFYKALADAARKSVLVLIEDLKANML